MSQLGIIYSIEFRGNYKCPGTERREGPNADALPLYSYWIGMLKDVGSLSSLGKQWQSFVITRLLMKLYFD